MFTRVTAEGAAFELLDPDASMLRDALPGSGYEPAVCALLKRSLQRPGTVFLDVGALYGFFSVWAAKATPATVVAFEPGPRYAAVLEHNLRLNGCEGVRVERVALAERTGSARFSARTLTAEEEQDTTDRAQDRGAWSYLRGLGNHLRRGPAAGEPITAAPGYWRAEPGPWLAAATSERLGLFTQGADQDEVEVALERLDDWVTRTGIVPQVVKIDVHGGEVGVLRGMTEQLRRRPLELLIEVHTSDLLVAGSHAELVETLEAAGLDVFELRGFRGRQGRLVPLVGAAREQLCDQRRWTASELYFMRFLYARSR